MQFFRRTNFGGNVSFLCVGAALLLALSQFGCVGLVNTKAGEAAAAASSTKTSTNASSHSQSQASSNTASGSNSNSGSDTTVSGSSLNGQSTNQTLNLSSSNLHFNSVKVGASSTQSVTLTNSGGTVVNISDVSISGAGFSASGVSSGTILQSGQSATLNVTYAPAAEGSVNGSVTITSTAGSVSANAALSGTGTAATNYSVSLNWNPSSGTISGYDVYRSTVSGGSYTQLNSSPVVPTQFTDGSVQSGQTYYYVVTAVNAAGTQSTFSNQASATIP